jgi:hypothetical protein
MKTFFKIAVLMMVAGVLSGCAGTHAFGPYSGKVIDRETSEPIEGAVVFVRFFTQIGHFAGTSSYFADAVEVLTDSKGEFAVPIQRLRNTEMGRFWDDAGHVIIYKPGYGCYPGHRKTEAEPLGFPGKAFVVVKLPKLNTEKERKDNLNRIHYYSDVVPYEKQRHILKLINQERLDLGFKPIEHTGKQTGGQ